MPASSNMTAGIAKPKRERPSSPRIIGTSNVSQKGMLPKRPRLDREAKDTLFESSIATPNRVNIKAKSSTESFRQGSNLSRTAANESCTEPDKPASICSTAEQIEPNETQHAIQLTK